ncbi:hypothetical protein, partial [Candidatus Burkholderia verschuerenii]|uniref:hypothetical protein n=1 Tax=Candidatus Burkholderia verschuerenii TaxID=242163 RepID=UPI001E30AA6F
RTLPCRRFADHLAVTCARLGADVVRYSFIAVDFHHLLLASLPVHSENVTVGRAKGQAKTAGIVREAENAPPEGIPNLFALNWPLVTILT